MKIHWADRIAKELLERTVAKHAIASGTSISGTPHIGNANDVIRADVIRRAVVEAGHDAELVWISDNMDPLRRVPVDLPASMNDYLGFPYSSIPDPEGCHPDFAAHYEAVLLKELKALSVSPTIYRGNEMYRAGLYNEAIRIAFEKRDKIIQILNRFREKPLDEHWYPFTPVCEQCGRIATTRVVAYRDGLIEYTCEDSVVGREKPIPGCKHRGTMRYDAGKGKLVWRVEWASRWWFLNVTCEPFGKEHAAAGGSWDTGRLISKEVYNYEPPLPVVYEHFMVAGKKMSKSLGNVVTVSDWLACAPPETLRFYLVAGDINSARDMDLRNTLNHVLDEFQYTERVYFGTEKEREKPANDEVQAKHKRIYELSYPSTEEIPANPPTQVPYGFAAMLAQVSDGREEKIIEVLKRINRYREGEREAILRFVARAGEWAKRYQPEGFTLQFTEPGVARERLDLQNRTLLAAFVASYEQNEVRDAASSAAKSAGKEERAVFEAVYLALFAKPRGPRLSSLEDTLGKEELLKRLRAVLA